MTLTALKSQDQLKWLLSDDNTEGFVVSKVLIPQTLISVFLTDFAYFSYIKQLLNCPHEAGWTPFQTLYFQKNFQGIAGSSLNYNGKIISICPETQIIAKTILCELQNNHSKLYLMPWLFTSLISFRYFGMFIKTYKSFTEQQQSVDLTQRGNDVTGLHLTKQEVCAVDSTWTIAYRFHIELSDRAIKPPQGDHEKQVMLVQVLRSTGFHVPRYYSNKSPKSHFLYHPRSKRKIQWTHSTHGPPYPLQDIPVTQERNRKCIINTSFSNKKIQVYILKVLLLKSSGGR